MYRLCRQLGILRPQRPRKPHRPRRLTRPHRVTAPNQLWATDLKYGYIHGWDRFFDVQCILDVYDRQIVAYHIGLHCRAEDAARTLQHACALRGAKPAAIRTDNGPQFVGAAWIEACEGLGIEHERIPYETPEQNAHIEAFHAILEEECLSRHKFADFAEAYAVVTGFIDFYNRRRLHGALGYRSPQAYYEAYQSNHASRLARSA